MITSAMDLIDDYIQTDDGNSIKTDIDKQARNATKPDIGADEFVASALDAGATALDSPAMGFCYGKKKIKTSPRKESISKA